jgi:RhtB (resistance to homoserine/threonine) family protein
MEYIPAILTVAAIHLMAVMSPGPDFIMTMRNSLIYSRRSGVYSAVGLGLGILVHVAYCLAGIALIISQSIVLFTIIKYFGAAYLIYIGYKSLRAKRSERRDVMEADAPRDMTKWQAIRSGFITNATNPKATLFFLSLFTLIIQPSTPFGVKLIMGGEMAVVTALWFSLIAVLVSHRVIRHRITRFQHYIERFMGAVLILFGIKLATVSAK